VPQRLDESNNAVTLGNTPVPPAVPAIMQGWQMDNPVVPAYDGIYSWSFRYPTFSTDTILAQRGYPFVENMLNMSSCRAIFDLKRYNVLQDGWVIESAVMDHTKPGAEDAQHIADAVSYALNNIRNPVTDLPQDFRNILFASMMGAWTGNRFAEIVWRYFDDGDIAGMHGFRGIWDKPNEQMAFDVDPDTLEVINATSYTPAYGYQFDVPMEKMVWYTHAMQRNDPHGVGDWRASYKHWFRLDNNLKFWAIALERWGAPVLLLKYPAADPSSMQLANKAASNIRQGANVVVPNNVDVEPLEAPTGVFQAMKEAAEYDARQISLVIHSNILSTGEGEHGSTSAGAKEHGQVGSTIYDAMSIAVENAYNQQLIHRFVRYNYGDKALKIMPRLRLRKQNNSDISVMANVLSILHNIGNLPSRSRVIRDQLGWPPISAEEEKMLDEEQKAQQEAQERANDMKAQGMTSLNQMKMNGGGMKMKNDGASGAAQMSDSRMDDWVVAMTEAIMIRNRYPQLIKQLAAKAEW
jgi:hypothetical protein